MEIFKDVANYAHFVTPLVVVVSFIWMLFLWARGILPAIIRLGNGLARRKIAIFAKGDNLTSLKSLLIDSKLFNEKNICEIITVGDIGRAEQASVYLVYWADWQGEYKNILDQKKDGCALLIYAAPRGLPGSIPDAVMKELDTKRNTAVTNFRGRLLNDIVTAMITTGYARK